MPLVDESWGIPQRTRNDYNSRHRLTTYRSWDWCNLCDKYNILVSFILRSSASALNAEGSVTTPFEKKPASPTARPCLSRVKGIMLYVSIDALRRYEHVAPRPRMQFRVCAAAIKLTYRSWRHSISLPSSSEPTIKRGMTPSASTSVPDWACSSSQILSDIIMKLLVNTLNKI